MRFSAEVKEFWTVGMSLFHARFIRFIGGFKSLGLLTDGSDAQERTFCQICPELILSVQKSKV